MIPKVIHSVWVGPRPMPAQHQRWMAQWREQHPDFAFMHWTEDNIDRTSEWVRVALHRGEWACASDAIRLQVLHAVGGIYLDTDVEVVRPLHPLLDEGCVIGWTSTPHIPHDINNAVIAARPGHPLIARALARTLAIDPWHVLEPGPVHAVRDALFEYGALRRNLRGNLHGASARPPESLRVDDVLVVPSRVFYPYDWTEAYNPSCVTPDTLCVHHWSLSWDAAWRLKQAGRTLPERLPWMRRPVALVRHGWKLWRATRDRIRRHLDRAAYR
jgi:hypothetical protein